ncbi:S8 family serine peptidase [Rufibacter tibetensis]|uniref:Peptidase S8 n=1 Tax=Rufibacter tibetensis TaxID=512763 RepID=A0A0P0C6C0_9BACT|nr:S8 family serine peptidase [Rufibacter tibetensis]ALJ00536.1 peptidase S8 [Rufibacter tibetensis]
MKKILTVWAFALFFSTSLFGRAVVDRQVSQALQSLGTPVEVVVTFTGDGAPTSTQLQLLQSLGLTKGITYRNLPIAGVIATQAQVDALAQSPYVRSIFLNKKLSFFNNDGNNLTGVHRLRKDQTLTARNKGVPVSGKGIGVVINDSGVDGTHDDVKLGTHLVQNVLGTTNLASLSSLLPVTYVENVPNTDTNSGHGTHCAGTVGGNGAKSNGLYAGAAPGASLVGYGSGGALFILDAIGGYDYALTHQYQYGIRVISNSWGTSGDFEPLNPVNIASKKAYDMGIVSVFAAGNDGPSSDTHNPYAIAPWVISVGAGDKFGKLADFSSRGVKGEGGTFTYEGENWNYENRPTLVGTGVDVISTRVIAPVSSLSADMDAAELEPAHVPFYTHMSGTSMATPQVAGIVALLLEANPSLTPAQVKEILQKTATNMPGYESWEVGAGYVNAYAAVDHIYRNTAFGSFQNYTRTFKGSVNTSSETQPFTINFNPAVASNNQITFNVASGINSLEAKFNAHGLLGETGNPVSLVLVSPSGVQYRSGIPVAFTLYHDRGMAVASPEPGTWILRAQGLNGLAIPETIAGTLNFSKVTGTTGLTDIAGHPAEASIKMAVSARLVDALSNGFKPNETLKRIQLAEYLMMGQGIRQFMPTNGTLSFTDLSGVQALLGESVTAKGAALRDRDHSFNGVMTPAATGKFNPTGTVQRAQLAYTLVQSLGLQQFALERNGKPVTVTIDGQSYPIEDAASIPAGLEGFVSVALDLNLINAFYSVTQGPYDLFPKMHANFKPLQEVTRAEFAVIVTRTHESWNAVTQPTATSTSATIGLPAQAKNYSYPNPFTGSTTISYTVEQAGFVTVEVYNLKGGKIRTLVNEEKAVGTYTVPFRAENLPTGTYLYKVFTPNKEVSNKMILTK